MRLKSRSLMCLAAAVVASHSFVSATYSLAQAAPPPPGSNPEVSLTAEAVTLEWRTPPVEITAQSDGTVSVALPGYSPQSEPGEPALPVASALVALPPNAAPTLELLQIDEQTLPLPAPLAGSGTPPAHTVKQPVQLDLAGLVRGVRLARVIFYPVRPAANELQVTTRVRVTLKFNVPAQTLALSLQALDPLLSTIQAAVVNPSQLQPLPAAEPATVSASAGLGQQMAVEVSLPGLTAITYSALAQAGFTVTNPTNLHLTRAGAEIAMQQDDAGQRLLFYAAPRFSRWTASDAYFLSQDTTPGLRMASRSAAPAGLPSGIASAETTSEVNALYMPAYCHCGQLPFGRDGDQWMWDALRSPDHVTATYPITLSAVATDQPANLTVWLVGYTDILTTTLDHRIGVAVNNTSLGAPVEWDGKKAITATFSIPSGVLQEGVNSLRLTQPGIAGVFVEGAWLDALSIRYARSSASAGSAAAFAGEAARRAYTIGLDSTAGLRAYDVTAEDQPVALTDLGLSGNTASMGDPSGALPHRYALTAESGIQTPAHLRLTTPLSTVGAANTNYVIITYPDFVPALADLVALRQKQGLNVAVENVRAIYDAYGGGRPEPEAIRAYLKDVYTTTRPAPPTYVLLVGNGTYDPKRYRSNSSATFIPPYLANIDLDGSETAADNRYVAVDGADNLPDMLIGRLPVNSLDETWTVVNKIVRYETQPAFGDWNNFAAFVADQPDQGLSFFAQSDAAAAVIPSSFGLLRFYYAPPATPFASLKQAVLQRWNLGAELMVYTGHASIHQWVAERLFHSDDVAGLNNGARLPVLLEMTCFTGSFHVPDSETLDAALVRHPNGGAVAVWGATGLGFSTGHQALADGFLRQIYQPNATLGEAALAGKLNLALTPDLVDTYTLLGDPATRLNVTFRPWPFSISLPWVRR